MDIVTLDKILKIVVIILFPYAPIILILVLSLKYILVDYYKLKTETSFANFIRIGLLLIVFAILTPFLYHWILFSLTFRSESFNVANIDYPTYSSTNITRNSGSISLYKPGKVETLDNRSFYFDNFNPYLFSINDDIGLKSEKCTAYSYGYGPDLRFLLYLKCT